MCVEGGDRSSFTIFKLPIIWKICEALHSFNFKIRLGGREDKIQSPCFFCSAQTKETSVRLQNPPRKIKQTEDQDKSHALVSITEVWWWLVCQTCQHFWLAIAPRPLPATGHSCDWLHLTYCLFSLDLLPSVYNLVFWTFLFSFFVYFLFSVVFYCRMVLKSICKKDHWHEEDADLYTLIFVEKKLDLTKCVLF